MTVVNPDLYPYLMELKGEVGIDVLFPVIEPAARKLVPVDPYAFCVASCLDRGAKAEIIWTIPYWISKIAGHLDPATFNIMPLHKIEEIFTLLPKKPRYINAAPKTFLSITRIIIDDFDGCPQDIWVNKKAMDVKKTFMQVFGVGNGIANMVLILIENAYKISFSDLDHTRMDIKPDVHTMRVLFRLGESSQMDEIHTIEAARLISPQYPGAIDGPLWYLGKSICHSVNPQCNICKMSQVCQKVGV